MLRRALVFAAAAATATGGSLVGGAVTSHAAAQYVACSLTGAATFSSPGLLATKSQTLTFSFSGKMATCRSSDGTIKSGTATASGTVTGTCASNKASGTYAITWSNLKTSGGNLTATGVGALTALSTKGTSGEFSGSSGHGTLAFQTTTPANCVKPGLTSATFTGAVDSP